MALKDAGRLTPKMGVRWEIEKPAPLLLHVAGVVVRKIGHPDIHAIV